MRAALLFSLCSLSFAQSFVLEHATVIDATGAAPKKDYSIVITDGRIAALRPAGEPPPAGAAVVDATGKFLIPGLWDMHAHVPVPQISLPLFVANGVTGIREMYSALPADVLHKWATLADAPHIVASGFIDGPLMQSGANRIDAAAVTTPDEARAAVVNLSARGADFLKIYNSVPREAFFALADEARNAGIPFVGHVPEAVSPTEASAAGMHSQEHLNNLLLNASSQEAKLRAERVAMMFDPNLSGQQRLRLLAWPPLAGLVDTYDEAKAAAMFQTFIRNQTWQTPTLALLDGFVHEKDMEFLDDPRRRYLPKVWTSNWDPSTIYYLRDESPAEYEVLHQRMRMLMTRYRKLVGDMHRAGVGLLAGTDTSPLNPVLPGWGLHQELALLVECGLTPLEALQTATRNPALYFGTLKDSGTIEVGKAADLVLLNADPLEDIHNTQAVESVVLKGRYYARAELDVMLERVAQISATAR